MDQRERNVDFEEALRTAIEAYGKSLWTALPAIVVSYDPATVTCTAQPALAFNYRNNQGKFFPTTIPPIQKVPVVFPRGGGMMMSWTLQAGDEVLLTFADRCIDGWWQQGAYSGGNVVPAAQAELRYHDLSDAIALPGLSSQANLPVGIATTGMRFGKEDGTAYVEVTPEGVVNIVGPAGINLIGPVNFDGVGSATGSILNFTGSIHATAEVTGNGIPLSTHLHTGVATGTDETGTPTV